MLFEYIDYFLDFFGGILFQITDKLVYDPVISKFVFIPLAVGVIFVIIDLIFDIRDSADFNHFVDGHRDYRLSSFRFPTYKQIKRFVASENVLEVSKSNDIFNKPEHSDLKKTDKYNKPVIINRYSINPQDSIDFDMLEQSRDKYYNWIHDISPDRSPVYSKNGYYRFMGKALEREAIEESIEKRKQNETNYRNKLEKNRINLDVEYEE